MSRTQKTDGTSRCLAQMENIKRQSLFKPYYYPIPVIGERDKMEDIKPALVNGTDESIYNALYDALNYNSARRRGLQSWQYQDNVLYFTKSFSSAMKCARAYGVFGEIGLIATDLLFAIEKLDFNGWNPDAEMMKTIEMIKDLYYGERFPIVFVFDRYNAEDIIRIERTDTIYFKTDELDIFLHGKIIYLRPEDDYISRKAARKISSILESKFTL